MEGEAYRSFCTAYEEELQRYVAECRPAIETEAKRDVLNAVLEQINDCGAGLFPPDPVSDRAFAAGVEWAKTQVEIELFALEEN